MQQQVQRSFGTARTTALGGVLFLLPMIVIGVLLGYAYHFAALIFHLVKPWIPFDTATGIALVFCALVALLLVACFIAGWMAQRAIGRHFTQRIQKQLIKAYPRYAIYKDLLASKLVGSEHLASLGPVAVKKEDAIYLAFAADRLASGLVVVYFPGAPDPWAGTVALMEPENVRPIDLPFSQVLEICEHLGRGSGPLLDQTRRNAAEGGALAFPWPAADETPGPELR